MNVLLLTWVAAMHCIARMLRDENAGLAQALLEVGGRGFFFFFLSHFFKITIEGSRWMRS